MYFKRQSDGCNPAAPNEKIAELGNTMQARTNECLAPHA